MCNPACLPVRRIFLTIKQMLPVFPNPTPFPWVNELLDELVSGLQAALGDDCIGLYLYGSLATGDFDEACSDIDFAAVTGGELPPRLIASLEAMHHALAAGGKRGVAHLEGAYLPLALVRHHDPDAPPCPCLNEGVFGLERLGSDWIIQRHVLREHAAVVAGPAPAPLIDPVSPEQLREAIRGLCSEWWFPMLENPSWLAARGPEYHAFAVISMCRVLHGLAHGTIVSKPAAVRWAMAACPDWQPLMERALASRQGGGAGFLDEALALIRFVSLSGKIVPESDLSG
jgi:hypothetical protein